MKPIILTDHVRERLTLRGATEFEVFEAINHGQASPAREGKLKFELVFEYGRFWKGKYYSSKRLEVIAAETSSATVVVTVYTYYF